MDRLNLLDCSVAIRVMGWELFNYEEQRRARVDEYADLAMRNDGFMWKDPDNENNFFLSEAHCFSPTGNPKHALMVLDKMFKDGWLLDHHASANEHLIKFSHRSRATFERANESFCVAVSEAAVLAVSPRRDLDCEISLLDKACSNGKN